MCTVLLPPGGYPIAVNKYIISYIDGAVVYSIPDLGTRSSNREGAPTFWLHPTKQRSCKSDWLYTLLTNISDTLNTRKKWRSEAIELMFTLQRFVVILCTTRMKIQTFCILNTRARARARARAHTHTHTHTQCIYMFCTVLRIKSGISLWSINDWFL